jgi:hypothetical protein
MTLINDNIPQYWQHSLRDNNKTLKRHLRNHPFKQEVAEEMLQTLAGKRRLEESIPQIQTLEQKLSLKGAKARLKSITLKQTPLSFDETYKVEYTFKEKWLS